MLPWSRDLVRLSSAALKLPCCHALMLLCSCAIVLSCSHALVRLQTRSYISIDGSLRSTYIPLSIADERAKRASKAVSCCHLIVVACSWAAVLTHYHVLMNSCSRVPALMPSCYRSPTLSYRRGSGHALFFPDFANRLVCSDSLPAPSSIPRESIRSLGNSLPVLARTGFQNRAPVVAKRSFLKIKVLLSRGCLQERPKRLQELSKRL